MSHLSRSARDALPDSAFGLHETRTYPMPDKTHARNAKARAAGEFNRGVLSAHDRACVDTKADLVLGIA